MLKLYKRGRRGVRYWEAWSLFDLVYIHEGKLGTRGKDRRCVPAEDQTADEFIEAAARKPRAQGYAEIPRQQQRQFVVQYRLASWGAPEDVEKARRVEGALNGCLGWTGNGRCTGHDIGSGTLNVFSVVVDPALGAEAAVAELRKRRLLKGATVALEEDQGWRVVYPKRFRRTFSLA